MAALTISYDQDGEVFVIGGEEADIKLMKEALDDVLAGRDHAHCTFFAQSERTKQIYGITDDENGCVMTRDGEQPAATINLFVCK